MNNKMKKVLFYCICISLFSISLLGAAEWDSNTVYTGGDTCTWNSKSWEAKWWTRGQEPGTTGPWGVWKELETLYTLTIDAGMGSGLVELDPSGGSYTEGTIVTLTANKSIGDPCTEDMAFGGWDGDLTGNENPTTILMDSDKNVTAYYAFVWNYCPPTTEPTTEPTSGPTPGPTPEPTPAPTIGIPSISFVPQNKIIDYPESSYILEVFCNGTPGNWDIWGVLPSWVSMSSSSNSLNGYLNTGYSVSITVTIDWNQFTEEETKESSIWYGISNPYPGASADGLITITANYLAASPTPAPSPTPVPEVPEWQAYINYSVSDSVLYNGTVYQCRQTHMSLPGWEPHYTAALWL